jgi:hypothetical protein
VNSVTRFSVGLFFAGSYRQGSLGQGLNEKWLGGDNGYQYFILPTGDVYRWNGKFAPLATQMLLGRVDPMDYVHPELLFAPLLPAAVQINGNLLTITTNAGYIGRFYVLVTVSDGITTTKCIFAVQQL